MENRRKILAKKYSAWYNYKAVVTDGSSDIRVSRPYEWKERLNDGIACLGVQSFI